MAEWSQLPKDLLEGISGRLDTSIDLLRFRSICTSWRSSSLSRKPQSLPGTFRILPNDGIAHIFSSICFRLSTRTILLISPLSDPALDEAEEVGRCSSSSSSSWLIKVEERGHGVDRKRRLLHPLTRSRYSLSSCSKFPRRLDLSNYRVLELGQEYVLHHVTFKSHWYYTENLYMGKVVLIFLNGEGDFVLLTIHSSSGKLAMFKRGEKRWTIIPDRPARYDDVIAYKGKFFAVDNTGRTVVVGLDRELVVAANPVFGAGRKLLVKSSRDELLLVDMYLSIDTGEGALSFEETLLERLTQYMSERNVGFKVFKLDEEGKNWIEMESLGDQVLFLGDDSSFVVSSSDLPGCNKGNRIIFALPGPFLEREDGVMGVFELETGCAGPLANYPGHSNLFWPPPQWVISTSSDSVAPNQRFDSDLQLFDGDSDL